MLSKESKTMSSRKDVLRRFLVVVGSVEAVDGVGIVKQPRRMRRRKSIFVIFFFLVYF